MDWLQSKTTQVIALVGIVSTLAGFGYTGATYVNRITNLEAKIGGIGDTKEAQKRAGTPSHDGPWEGRSVSLELSACVVRWKSQYANRWYPGRRPRRPFDRRGRLSLGHRFEGRRH